MTEIDKINVRKSSYDRVFFAGEHTMWSENTYATVDVAYQSGIRAAKELIEAMSKPSTPSTTTSPSTTSTSRGSNCFHPLDLLSVLSTLFISAVLLL